MPEANEVRATLRSAAERKKITPAELSRELDRAPGYLSDFLRDKKVTIAAAESAALEKRLDLPPGSLVVSTREPLPEALASYRRPLIRSFSPEDPPEEEDRADERPSPDTFPPGAIKELVSHGGLGQGEIVEHTYQRERGGQTEVDAVKSEYWMFPPSFVKYALGAQVSHLLAIECDGDSMEPTISPGERVWANTMHTIPSPDGLYAIRDALNQIIVKRLELVPGPPGETPRVRVISDNPKHGARETGLDELAIIGKVVCGLRLL